MKNKQLYDILASKWVESDTCKIIRNSNGKIGWEVKQPTNIIRKEYPYFKRLLRALLGKPTWYEVNEWISPVFNEAKGDEIKLKVMEYK